MKEAELLRCQIGEWYPRFRRHSIKTLIHPLPDSFLRYLLQDDGPFLLPASASGVDPLPRHPNSGDPFFSDTTLADDEEEEGDGTSGGSGSDSDGGESLPDPPCFPELESAVQESIKALGGAVFPKLNWSAPKDAASMGSGGSLRCATFSEIVLLLKSSDCITHDLCHALESCSDREQVPSTAGGFEFYLALRKWHDSLRPEMEFRCFVRRRRLVGICQREVTTFYPVLAEKKHDLEPLIRSFFEDVVRPEFGSEDYTFDLYVTRNGSVKILDFNPWGSYTLPLLFDWEELERKAERPEGEGAEFKVIEDRCGVRPGLKTAVPYDYLDMGVGSGWDQFLRRVDDELRGQALDSEAGGG